LRKELDKVTTATDLVQRLDNLIKRLDPIEQALIQVNMKGSEANLAFPGMLNEQYATFAASVEDADTPPTKQQLAEFAKLHTRLGAQLDMWSKIRSDDIPGLNKAIQKLELPAIEFAAAK
jgi:hypothetical protein